MKRLGPGPDRYVRRILRRAYHAAAHARRGAHAEQSVRAELARELDCDESRISHQMSESATQTVDVDELVAYCDVLDTVEPISAMAEALGYELVRRDRPTIAPAESLEREALSLMEHVGRFAELLRGGIDPNERGPARAVLTALVEITQSARSKIPEVSS